jgi:hypothetical protein
MVPEIYWKLSPHASRQYHHESHSPKKKTAAHLRFQLQKQIACHKSKRPSHKFIPFCSPHSLSSQANWLAYSHPICHTSRIRNRDTIVSLVIDYWREIRHNWWKHFVCAAQQNRKERVQKYREMKSNPKLYEAIYNPNEVRIYHRKFDRQWRKTTNDK